jgi:hypothetical protein
VAATSYEDRLQLIAAQLSYVFPFLFDDGREAANQDNDQIELSEYSDDVLGALAHSSNMSDPDSGPFDVWRWTHQQSSRAGFVFSDEHTQLREFGYVMWDRKRLLEHDLLSTQWMNPRSRPYDPDEHRRRQDDMSRSFDLRSEIWRRGGEVGGLKVTRVRSFGQSRGKRWGEAEAVVEAVIEVGGEQITTEVEGQRPIVVPTVVPIVIIIEVTKMSHSI